MQYRVVASYQMVLNQKSKPYAETLPLVWKQQSLCNDLTIVSLPKKYRSRYKSTHNTQKWHNILIKATPKDPQNNLPPLLTYATTLKNSRLKDPHARSRELLITRKLKINGQKINLTHNVKTPKNTFVNTTQRETNALLRYTTYASSPLTTIK